jgi:HlyD family secretion protein
MSVDIPLDPERSGKRRRNTLIAGAAVVVIAGLLAWPHLHGKADAGDNNAPPLVTVIEPKLGPVGTSVYITGQVAAQNDMPIGVEGEGGRISEVLAEPGDRVHRGQVLARISPLTQQSQVDSASASLDELRAAAATSQAEFQRAQGARDSFSAEEYERRRTAALTTQARVKAAEAQLSEARTRFQRTTVEAPTDGIVLTRSAEVGQIAVPGGSPLFRLARSGQLEMRGLVAEQDMPHLKVGQAAEVRLDGIAAPFAGKVWQLGAVIDPLTRQGSVRIELPMHDANLRPGAFARAEVRTPDATGVLLPQTAVLSDAQGTYALIVGAGDKVERRAVKVAGARSEGLLVTGGLNGSERVVAVAGAFLREGEQIKLAPPPQGALAGGEGGGSGVTVSAKARLP